LQPVRSGLLDQLTHQLLIHGVVVIRGLAAQVFGAASRSAVPSLVAGDDLARANAAIGAGTYGLEALGPLVAAALIPVVEVCGVLFVDAATFAVSTVLLTRLPAVRPGTSSSPVTFLAATAQGLRYIARTPAVRAIAAGFVAVVAFNGVDDVALLFLVKDNLAGSDAQVALVYAGVGIGLAVGYPLLARRTSGVSAVALLVLGFVINSAGNLLTGLAWAVWVALALQSVRGAGISALDVGVNTELQRVVPVGLLNRVFGTVYGAVGVAAGLSYVLGGLLLDRTTARTTFIVAGVGGLAATAVTAVVLRRRLRPTRVRHGPQR
jgi:Major Facilitator Superfamily